MYHGNHRTHEPPFDVDALDAYDPFELDHVNCPHLAKHEGCDPELLYSMWAGERRYVPAKYGPAHWFLLADVGGIVYCAVLMPSEYSGSTRCRPIGLMKAPAKLEDMYRDLVK